MSDTRINIPYLRGLQLAVRWLAFAYLLRTIILNRAAFFDRVLPTTVPSEMVIGHLLLCSLLVFFFWRFPVSQAAVVFLDLFVGIALLLLYRGNWAFVLPLFLATFTAGTLSWEMALATSITATLLFLAENIFRLGLTQELLFHPDWLMLLILNLALSGVGLLRSESARDKERRDSLISLIESGQELGSTLTYEQLFKLAFGVVKSMFSADTSVIYLKNSDGVMQVRAAESAYSKFFHDFNPHVAKTALAPLVRDKQAQLFEDVFQLSQSEERVLPRAKTIRAGMAVPLVFEGESIGLIFAAGKDPKMYNAEMLRLFIVLANQTAISLRNVQLHATTFEMAITDSVSGLYTHSYMQEVLEREFGRHKYANLPLSGIIVDVDYFKIVNDTYGHPQGDSLLRQLGGVIKTITRGSDSVCRYGGDEFMVILPETSRVGAVLVAERIRQAVEEYEFVVGSKVVHIAVSAGVASFPEDVGTKKELIDSADQALYRAKQEGRNKVCFGGR